MTKKSWIIFFVIVAGLLLLLVLASRSNPNLVDVSDVDVFAIQEPNQKNGMIKDNFYGNASADTYILEYGDFQCPGCGNVHPIVKALVEANKENVKYVFRNYPIVNAHPNARAAAAAAESAGLQGKYWEMHNLLYENQSAWSYLNAEKRTEKFTEYAQKLGLDIDKFKADMGSEPVNQKINYDFAIAKKQNVTGTPTFFVNGKLLDPSIASDETKFKQFIQDSIDQSKNKSNN